MCNGRFSRYTLPNNIGVGRGWCGLILLMMGDDPDAMGRTRSRTRVLKGSASAALLSVCSPGRCYIPGRPRRVAAKTETVVTGSRLSGITEGIIGHDPVAMARMAGSTVGLYAPTFRPTSMHPPDIPSRCE